MAIYSYFSQVARETLDGVSLHRAGVNQSHQSNCPFRASLHCLLRAKEQGLLNTRAVHLHSVFGSEMNLYRPAQPVKALLRAEARNGEPRSTGFHYGSYVAVRCYTPC